MTSNTVSITYKGTIVGDRYLKGTFNVPESLIGRQEQERGHHVIDLSKLSATMLSFLERQEGRLTAHRVIDLELVVVTGDGLEFKGTYPQGFPLVSDQLAINYVDLKEIPKPKAETPAPQVPPTGHGSFEDEDRDLKPGHIVCPKCKGKKYFEKNGYKEDCRRCDGSGSIWDKETADAQKFAALPKDKRERLEREADADMFASYLNNKARGR